MDGEDPVGLVQLPQYLLLARCLLLKPLGEACTSQLHLHTCTMVLEQVSISRLLVMLLHSVPDLDSIMFKSQAVGQLNRPPGSTFFVLLGN